MALDYTVETLDGLSEDVASQYFEKDGKFVLDVSGIETGDGLKKALEAERKARKAAEAKNKTAQDEKERQEQKALEEKEEFQTLYETEKQKNKKLSETVINGKKNKKAESIVSGLTSDTKKAKLLKDQVLKGLVVDEEGEVSFSGVPGITSADEMKDHLKVEFSFLVDGSKAGGGGAGGSDDAPTGKTLTKDQFESKNEMERHKFIREGGTITV